ncbi:MAG: PEP-CTERM sorting domain-containing protein [Microcoleaceae cyanobacterium]
MKTLQSLLIGTTVATTALATSTIAISPAEAFQLTGSIGIVGTSVFGDTDNASPETTTLGFTSNEIGGSGDFANLSEPIDIKTLDLTRDGSSYSYNQTTSWINFGEQDLGNGLQTLTFDLDAGLLTRTYRKENSLRIVDIEGITGQFMYGGETIGSGWFSASQSGTSSRYEITLETEEVPEPLSILGTVTALGFGAMLKKKGSTK